MTSPESTIQAKPTAMHPTWCALEETCTSRPNDPEHRSRGSRWQACYDDVEITVQEVRLDEVDPRSGKMPRGPEGVRLSLTNTALVGRYSDVVLDRADMEILLGILMRVQERLEHRSMDVPEKVLPDSAAAV